ncbi:MAG: DUF4160 domain-containing protein [Lachnospiraceae bacterium]|jgi:hypothetical protein|nr:DUF4160 domain-containing protein [Lachnospiraceae bacterium]
MPQILKIGPYLVYFWSNEGEPLEPIHVHIAEGRPTQYATKLWVTKSGKLILVNNNSGIPETILRKMIRMLEGNITLIVDKWKEQFGETRYFC